MISFRGLPEGGYEVDEILPLSFRRFGDSRIDSRKTMFAFHDVRGNLAHIA